MKIFVFPKHRFLCLASYLEIKIVQCYHGRHKHQWCPVLLQVGNLGWLKWLFYISFFSNTISQISHMTYEKHCHHLVFRPAFGNDRQLVLAQTFTISNSLYLMQVYKPAFLAMCSLTSDKLSLFTARRWCMAEGSQADSGFMRTFSLLTSQVNHFSHERRTLNEPTDRSQQAEVRATYVFPTFTCSNCFLSFQHPSAFQDREFLANFFLWWIFFLPEIGSVFLLAVWCWERYTDLTSG